MGPCPSQHGRLPPRVKSCQNWGRMSTTLWFEASDGLDPFTARTRKYFFALSRLTHCSFWALTPTRVSLVRHLRRTTGISRWFWSKIVQQVATIWHFTRLQLKTYVDTWGGFGGRPNCSTNLTPTLPLPEGELATARIREWVVTSGRRPC